MIGIIYHFMWDSQFPKIVVVFVIVFVIFSISPPVFLFSGNNEHRRSSQHRPSRAQVSLLSLFFFSLLIYIYIYLYVCIKIRAFPISSIYYFSFFTLCFFLGLNSRIEEADLLFTSIVQ